MDTASVSCIKPKTMAELLPGLSSILSKDSIHTLTAKKQPRQTIAHTRTAEKVIKPLTIAEMRADILALKVQSPRRYAQGATTNKKKTWNSSVKVDGKTVSHTANGQLKNNPVRKVLNFQSKPKPLSSSRTNANDSPKFSKPEFRGKKSLYTARNNVRISGIHNITQTPVVNMPSRSRMTLANKENISNLSNIKRAVLPKTFKPLAKKVEATIPDTPMSNESWKSSCDASFLQREKEIDVEESSKALSEEQRDNIAKATPPASTPFKNYRNVEDFFQHSREIDNSAIYHDNTIMSFDDTSDHKDKKREETVIVSLCDLLKKASVNPTPQSTELEDLLQIEKRTVNNIVTIENSIATLHTLKESQLSSLRSVRKLITEKNPNEREKADKTVVEAKETTNPEKSPDLIKKTESPSKEDGKKSLLKLSTIVPLIIENVDTIEDGKSTNLESPPTSLEGRKSSSATSVIKCTVKSPSYKIPKKNLCLRKKVFCKSMPNVTNNFETPVKADMGNRALSMYMKMKEHMNFLNTPVARRTQNIPDTPAMTSHNLQKQLDKLYGEY